jgi:hypothetical protein
VRRAQKKSERISCCGRECKAPYSDVIDSAGADFTNHYADRMTAQRFFHPPQRIACARCGDNDQPLGSNADLIETRPIGYAIFPCHQILSDPKHRSPGMGRQKTRGRCEREGCRGRSFGRVRGCNLVQRSAGKATGECAIDCRNAKLNLRAGFA